MADSQDQVPSMDTEALSSISQLHSGKSKRELGESPSLIRCCRDSSRSGPLRVQYMKKYGVGNLGGQVLGIGSFSFHYPIFVGDINH